MIPTPIIIEIPVTYSSFFPKPPIMISRHPCVRHIAKIDNKARFPTQLGSPEKKIPITGKIPMSCIHPETS